MVLPGLLLWFTLLPSGLEQPLVQAVLGYQSVMEAFGRISSSTWPVSPRRSHLEIWTLPSPSYFSVLLVFGCCLWGTSYFRDACAAWFNSGYIFYGRLWTNFSIFYVAVNSNPEAFALHSCRMEKCAESVLLVAVSLSAVRTLEVGHYFYERSIF